MDAEFSYGKAIRCPTMQDPLVEDGSETAGSQSTLLFRRFIDTLYPSSLNLGAYFLRRNLRR